MPQGELTLPVSQVLALLVKIVRKLSKRLVDIQKEKITEEIEVEHPVSTERLQGRDWKPLATSLEEELEEAGEEALESIKQRERQRELINSLDLKK